MTAPVPMTRMRIQELLRASQMNASQFARRSGLSWPMAQALAVGKPLNLKLTTMEKIAAALEVGVEELFVSDAGG